MIPLAFLRPAAPWMQRFQGAPLLWSALAAQNPQRGLVCRRQQGRPQLFAWEVATGRLTQLTTGGRGHSVAAIAADGEQVYYHAAEDGGLGHVLRVPFAGGPPVNLTAHMPPFACWYLTESCSGGFYGFMAAGEAGFQMFVVDARQGGTPHLRYESAELALGPNLSYDAELSVIATTGPGRDELTLEAYDNRSGARLGTVWDGAGAQLTPVGFVPRAHDLRYLATTRRSGQERPFIWNPRTGDRRDLALPELAGDVQPLDWSADGAWLLLRQVQQARHRLHRYHLPTHTLHPLAELPGSIDSAYFAPEERLLVHHQDAVTPPALRVLAADTGRPQSVLLADDPLPPAQPWQSITLAAADGTPVQAWLARPPGSRLSPGPAIIHAHGGPADVLLERYHPAAQAWVDHGFTWLSVNYRGSTTFGPEFAGAIIGQPGTLEVADLAAAADWLVAQGLAQPGAIFVSGAAYGGTLALLALSRYPQRWAGGLAQAAIADWRLMYEDEPEPLRAYQRQLFGGTPAETPAAHHLASPIDHIAALRAPLLIVQGRNDPDCPPRQMQQYEAALRDHGKSAQVVWVDAGYSASAAEAGIEALALMLDFATRLLPGGQL
ncbi:MAG: prolyl oligopeptidase family serine peptidase [Anaerolineae bacterium]|nr:prolyl oligopeptidase family serine peptidase [Anaerolineae bacterium]